MTAALLFFHLPFGVYLMLQSLLIVQKHGFLSPPSLQILLIVAHLLLLKSVFHMFVLHNIARVERRDVLRAVLLLVLYQHSVVVFVGLILLSFCFLQLLHPCIVVTLLFNGLRCLLLLLATALLHQFVELLTVELFVGTGIASRRQLRKHRLLGLNL